MNLIIDFIIRFIPFISDFADAIYKCNIRNTALLKNKLRKRGENRLKDINRRNEVDLSLFKIYDNIPIKILRIIDLRLDIRLGKNLNVRKKYIIALIRETKAGSAADER
jgi:Domain of unknown function (DUF4112)